MGMMQALGWAATILFVSLVGRVAGFDAESLVLLMAGMAAVRFAGAGCCGARA